MILDIDVFSSNQSFFSLHITSKTDVPIPKSFTPYP